MSASSSMINTVLPFIFPHNKAMADILLPGNSLKVFGKIQGAQGAARSMVVKLFSTDYKSMMTILDKGGTEIGRLWPLNFISMETLYEHQPLNTYFSHLSQTIQAQSESTTWLLQSPICVALP